MVSLRDIDGFLYKIEYEVNKEKYIVLKLKVKNPPKEERDQTEIFFNYKMHPNSLCFWLDFP